MASYQTVVDLYYWLYLGRYGQKPTWNGGYGRNLKRLIREHGADEVIDRLVRLYSGALGWAKEPYTWNLFVHSFDAIVEVRPRKVTASHVGRLAEELERIGQ